MGEPLVSLGLAAPLEVLELPKKLRTAAAVCPEGGHVALKLPPSSARELARWIDAHEKLSRMDAPREPAPAADLGDWPDMITVRGLSRHIWPDRPYLFQVLSGLLILALILWGFQ